MEALLQFNFPDLKKLFQPDLETQSILKKLNGSHGEGEQGEIATAIRKICSVLNGCVGLSACLKGINAIKENLSHKSDIVRNFAGEVIALMILKAAKFLLDEKDPRKIMEASESLLQTMQELITLNNNGQINMSAKATLNLNVAKEIIKEVAKMTAVKDQDQFVSSSKNTFGQAKSYFPGDEFIPFKQNNLGSLKLNNSPAY